MTVEQIQDRIPARLAEVDEARNIDARYYSPSEILTLPVGDAAAHVRVI